MNVNNSKMDFNTHQTGKRVKIVFKNNNNNNNSDGDSGDSGEEASGNVQLKVQLKSKDDEIAQLKAQLKSRDAEIAQLKAKASNADLVADITDIVDWECENKICSTHEKKENVSRELLHLVKKHGIEKNVLKIMREKLKQTPFVIKPGDLWKHSLEYFDGNEMLVEFIKDVSELTPKGIAKSPNADCGKYELLCRLLLPNSKQPKKGDFEDNGEIIEVKGDQARIIDPQLCGVQYRENCKKIFEGCNIEGNIVTKGGLKGEIAYEIEKKQHKEHFQKEFKKDPATSKKIIAEYFIVNGWSVTDKEIDDIFKTGSWNQETMNKTSCKKMFTKYKQQEKFDKMIIFGNGTDVKIITEAEDLDEMQIIGDYFRINQFKNVGWYVA
jgi:hypothetical protein